MEEPGSTAGRYSRQEEEASERVEGRLVRWDAAMRRSAAQLQEAEAAREHAQAARTETDHIHGKGRGVGSFAADERARLADHREADADERARLADHREADADERERLADQREADADERERLADHRQADADERDDLLHERQATIEVRESVAKRTAEKRAAQADERERLLRQREAEADERELSEEISRSAEALCPTAPEGGSATRSTADLAERGARLRVRAAELADCIAEEAEEHAAYMENTALIGDRERRLAIAATEHEIARIERQNAARLRDLKATYQRVEPLPKLPGKDTRKHIGD